MYSYIDLYSDYFDDFTSVDEKIAHLKKVFGISYTIHIDDESILYLVIHNDGKSIYCYFGDDAFQEYDEDTDDYYNKYSEDLDGFMEWCEELGYTPIKEFPLNTDKVFIGTLGE